ncbi:MAG: S1 RNA-binding domain-containing protein [Armatimonadetes bacterium]|nr:S1 RNA-binding domain-containing protein [Armatimonadota bacterium]
MSDAVEEREPQVAAVPPAADEEAGEEALTMDELMAEYDAAEPLQELREGDVVTGTVVQIDDQGVMVDVGTKSEGLIPRAELDVIRSEIEVGDRIQVSVLRIEDDDGHLVLSKRQADYERAWEDIVDKQDSGEIMEARVVEAVKGGLLVDLGVYGQGFVPASHVSVRRPRNLQKYVGQTLRLQVIEVERRRRRVVLSHRKVVEEQRAAEREETLHNLAEGQVRPGVVRRLTQFGAFVDIGGVDGLLHVSELSWRRVDHPEEELRVNQDLEVMVLKLNLEENRISLGRRQLLADPWREVPRIYREGQVIRAKVVRLLDDGAVVRLPLGVDGRVSLPDEVLHPAQEEPEAEPEAPGTVTEEVAAAADDEAPEALEAPEAVELAAAPASDEAPEPTPEEALAPASDEAPEPTAEEALAPASDEAPEPTPEEALAPASDEAPEPTPEEAPEADSDVVAPAPALGEGSEIEVRIDRIIPVERDVVLSLASSQPVSERGERQESRDAQRERTVGAPTLARGRYSDRRDGGEDDEGGEGRAGVAGRRDRRQGREREREREPDRTTPVAEPAPGPARRTLGDLMGDKLRALFQGEEGDSTAAGESDSGHDAAAVEEGSEEASK